MDQIEARIAEPFGELQGALMSDLRFLLTLARMAEELAQAHADVIRGLPGAMGASHLHAARLRALLDAGTRPQGVTLTPATDPGARARMLADHEEAGVGFTPRSDDLTAESCAVCGWHRTFHTSSPDRGLSRAGGRPCPPASSGGATLPPPDRGKPEPAPNAGASAGGSAVTHKVHPG